jgi:serine/threonine protein kinase
MVDMVQDHWCFRKNLSGIFGLNNSDDGKFSTCNIMVMEYCDYGTLSKEIRNGRFDNSPRVVLEVLLEVALAIQYMHSMRILHCDIKPANILLKTDNTTSKGYIVKLSDFGFSHILLDSDYVVNQTGGGTITHLAPEMFQSGSHLTYSVDSYAFGIMMWEIYTCKCVYSNMGKDSITDYVYHNAGRPKFPEDAHKEYRILAERCWSENSMLRPNFDTIVSTLKTQLYEITGNIYSEIESYDRRSITI